MASRKDSKTMARITSFAAFMAATALSTGCAYAAPAAPHNSTLYSIHQPVVQRTDYVIDLASSGGGLSASEAGRLGAWFNSLQLGYGDRIFVDEPAGYGSDATRADIAGVASAYGLLLMDGAPVTPGAIQPGTARVVVSRMTASVPDCPNWSYSSKVSGPISTTSNYGCAANTNLAAMIADPNDLVLGQAGASAGDAATASKAIKVYRDAVPTGSKGLKVEQQGSKQ
jgi:pilus assembly protein CpaD